MPVTYEVADIQFLDCLSAQSAAVEKEALPAPADPQMVQVEDSTIEEEHQRYRERERIYQLFNQLPYSLELQELRNPVNQIEADAVIDVQDYAVQGKIAELFREILSPLSFRQNKSVHPIRVFYSLQRWSDFS